LPFGGGTPETDSSRGHPLLTIIVVILFGNPSSGGANGVPTYFVVAAVILGVLDWRRSEARVDTEAAEAAAMTAPIGAAP
jgi:hypothetical protein